jgi:glycosyltransferase involved in cell wall biosynthesis
VEYFARQDYPNLELVVVDDGEDPISDCLPNDKRVRYVRLSSRLSVGAKRNLACRQATGEFVAHWDDDDWYPSWRISRQMQALNLAGADVCGSSCLYFFDATYERAWHYACPGKRNNWVAGSTFLYKKQFWERNRFVDVQVGEDARFLWSSVRKSVHDIHDPQICVAMIHSENTSRKVTTGAYWRECPKEEIDRILQEDIRRYSSDPNNCLLNQPLVSCIMPTYNRRAFVELALQHFGGQDYANKELIIVDDGNLPVEDVVKNYSGVRYVQLHRRLSIGAKRNVACQHAKGSLIAHWDDDDWYAPSRLRYQVAPLIANEADLTGLAAAFVLQLPVGKCWTITNALHRKMFHGNVHGGTLVYRKAIFDRGIRYPEVNLAEDAAFIRRAMAMKQRLMRLENTGAFIYMRHGNNAWQFDAGRMLDPGGWEETNTPENFPIAQLEQYCQAAERSAVTAWQNAC